jgi:hypothetical protein
MLVRLAEFGKATRGERAEEIVCYYRAHLRYLFAEWRALLFCFSWSANFRERKTLLAPTQRGVAGPRTCEFKARIVIRAPALTSASLRRFRLQSCVPFTNAAAKKLDRRAPTRLSGGDKTWSIALFVRLAKLGKEAEVAEGSLAIAEEEPATIAWFGIRLGLNPNSKVRHPGTKVPRPETGGSGLKTGSFSA